MHQLICRRLFEHAWYESNHLLWILVLQDRAAVAFIKKE